MALLLIL